MLNESSQPHDDKPPEVSPDQVGPPKDETPKSEPGKPEGFAPASEPGSQTIGIEYLSSHKTDFIKDQKNNHYYFNQQPGISNVVIRNFSLNDIWRISPERQQEIEELFVGNREEIEQLRCLLIEKRILVLSGESGLGKTTTAICLSSLLSADSGSGSGSSAETYLIPVLDRHTRIDLHELCEAGEITNRIVIFKNAFARNPDLRGFFPEFNKFSLGEFAGKLRDTNSYFIFTTTPFEAAQFLDEHADSDLQHQLRPLNDDLLLLGLEKWLSHLERASKAAKERLEELQKPPQQQILIARLRTMPRLVSFVESYLRTDSAIALGADLDEAIRQFDDITHWFHRELAADFDSWCFTLALGLCQCSPDSEDVSWIDFEYLHRGIARALKRDPELFPAKENSNEQPSKEASENAPSLTDDVYLRKCRAEVVKDPNSLADMIRFCEESYPERLWGIFLKHHRRILTILLPSLREMAEDYRAEDDSGRRELCARIIGRIGEMDPERVTLGVMNRWIQSDDRRHRANIGVLYQGILSSNNARYRNYFLEVLKSLTALASAGDDGDEAKDKLLTSIAVYSRIGPYDLGLSMQGLKNIARDKLVPTMENMQRVGRLMERTKSAFAQETSAREALGLLIFQEMLRDLAERLFAEQGSTFVGVQYALSSLCLSVDRLSVFKELRLWIESSNKATGALVALMFLIQDGIASTLESVQVEISNNESGLEERKSCNPINAVLTSGQESVIEMARFLVTIFEAFSVRFFLPKQFQDYLRESFLSHLTTWIEDALPVASCRKAMEELLTELMRIHNRILYNPIDNLFNSRGFLKQEPDLKKAFVNAVLWPPR
jgi:DNA polymerase III delta prime subunit